MSGKYKNLTFRSFCKQLSADRLPGETAQKMMAPATDRRPSVRNLDLPASRHSAVLILCSLQRLPSLLYTLRTQTLSHHRGQISFPGGRQESGESLLDTARREAAEEVGVKPDRYEIVCQLSPLFVPPSDFVIHPCLAFCDERPDIEIQPSEVSEAFWVPLEELYFRRNMKTGEWIIHDQIVELPYWDIHSVPLWGATAMITSEIVTLYQDYLKQSYGDGDGNTQN